MRRPRQGDIEAVKKALREGGDVKAADSSGRTPLYCAALNGHVAAAELLSKGEGA